MSFRLSLLVAAAVVVPATGALAAVSGGTAGTAPAGDFATGRVLVQFAPGATADDRRAIESAHGAREVGTVHGLGVHVLEVPAGAEQHVVDALSRSGRVAFAERDAVATSESTTPNDYWYPREWGPVKVNAPTAWDTTTGSSSVVVAVLDTGVTPEPDLAGKLVAGWDFVNNDSDPTDDHGHGTMAAGVVGAVSNNTTGVASYCWKCSIMPVKVMGADGTGNYSTIASGITWAVDHGAKVLSLSLSGTADSSTLHSAVTYAHNHGVVIAAAAGNSSCNCTSYPAAYAEVLGVAATESNDALSSYSNFGSWVKLAAPGTNYTTTYTGGYSTYAGTSSATPVVAGVAGLLLSTGATGAATESALESSAAKVGSFVAYGRVDAAAALAALGTSAPAPAPTTSPSPSPSTSPSAAPVTTTFTGTFTNKSTTQSWSQHLTAGAVTATLTFNKASSMTLSLTQNGQTITTASGASPSVSATVADGTYTWVVSGPARSSYTLTVKQ